MKKHRVPLFKMGIVITLALFTPAWSQYSAHPYNDSGRLQRVSQQKFTFAVLGDRTGSGPDSWRVFDEAVSEINRLRPDFVVMIGDVIEDSATRPARIDALWNEARQHLDSLNVPLFLVPGNNDIWNRTSYAAWGRCVGDTYTAFSHRDCRFVLLNTEEIHGTGEEGFGSRQLAFIEDEIRQNRHTKQFFFFCHQPVWMFSGPLKSQWEHIESLLGGIRYSVFTGHLHVLGATQRNGQRHLIVGPTGGEMRLPRNPSLGFFHHYTWVTVEGASSYVAFVEPGRVYSETTARKAYQRYLLGKTLLKGKLPFSVPDKKIP